jgi:hypothetical protein
MADESRSEERPLESAERVEPLRREVEPPRTAAGLWLPFMALASAAMLTITSGIAVMTRPPRAHIDGPGTSLPAKVQNAERETAELKQTVDQLILEQRAIDESVRWTDEALVKAKARLDAQPRVMCRAPVHRGNLDGDEQPYDECIVPPDVAARASTGPEVR